MVLGKGSLLSLSEQKEKGISVSQGIVVTECYFKISYARVILDHPDPDHLKGTHTKSMSILLLLSGNLKGHVTGKG